jgi:20S proteasome alpha/beta subunit
VEPGDFAVSGTGATYVIGYMDSHFPPGAAVSLTRGQCVRRVKRALALAVARDSMSGGPVTLCCVDAKGVERMVFTPAELRQELEGGRGGGAAGGGGGRPAEETAPEDTPEL